MTGPTAWFKSSHSQGDGGDCVEVAVAVLTVHIRDSKRRLGPQLAVPATAWAEFITNVGERL
ncbi:DUF397 domain-containing protein [Streptomyces orinoci]|uniref:DUF397 domain-containing protein n=1 Tax=Streptomyces orinoci TaxID=67339 RepID=A0ABV3K6E8_STRON|nr:DUF397 domain-containing protein [Streptomyces orinoci]